MLREKSQVRWKETKVRGGKEGAKNEWGKSGGGGAAVLIGTAAFS